MEWFEIEEAERRFTAEIDQKKAESEYLLFIVEKEKTNWWTKDTHACCWNWARAHDWKINAFIFFAINRPITLGKQKAERMQDTWLSKFIDLDIQQLF